MTRLRLAIVLIATAGVLAAPFVFGNVVERAAIQLAGLLATWLAIWKDRP